MNDLLIGGGGFDGFTFLGALEYIHKNNLLDLKNFYGCSIGSLIGIMYISGKSPTEILEFFIKIDPKEILKLDINNISKNNSLFDSYTLDVIIAGIDYPDETTLIDIYKDSGVHVNIFVTNVTKNEYQNLNDIDNPDIKLKDALKASMSIPLLFPPVEINKEKYIDGCCKNIYGSHPNDKYILGYCIIGQEDSVEYFNSVILSMINSKKPRGTFIITCKKLSSIANYTDVSTINKLEFLNYYCRGIEFAKDQLT